MEKVSGITKTEDSHPQLNHSTRNVLVGALMLTLLLEALDATAVGTAMPQVLRELGGLDRYTWVITIYLLGSTTIIPLAGKLSDQFGRKWFLVGGTALFILSSVLCGLAQSIEELIFFRALQGLGSGVGIGLVSTVVADLFPPAERPRWQGIVNSVYAVSSVAGPTLGGWLADNGPLVWPVTSEVSRWRWVFWLNLPLGLIALLFLLVWLPANLSEKTSNVSGWAAVRRIDFTGTLLTFTATSCLFLGLNWEGGDLLSPGAFLFLALALLQYAALLLVESRAVEPVLPLKLFRNGAFTAGVLLWVFQFMALLGMAFYVPLFIQKVMGATPTLSGTVMTPFSIAIPLGGFVAGNLISTLNRYRVVALVGSVFMTVGCILILFFTPDKSFIYVSLAVAVAGFGMGAITPVVFGAAQNSLSSTELGVGTGVVRYLGQLGGTVGVAVVGVIVNIGVGAGLPLGDALIQGQRAVLVFCLGAIIFSLRLKDPPNSKNL